MTAYFRTLIAAGVQYLIAGGPDAQTVRLLAEQVRPQLGAA
jgi:hypothetical protein